MYRTLRPFVLAAATVFVFWSTRAADTPLVNHGDSWRYRKGTSAPQAAWKTAADASLDATWLTGNGGIGYANNTTETSQCQTLLTDMLNGYTTIYMRRTFQVASLVDATNHLKLTMDWDDGFIAWLDGAYLTSALSPGAPSEPAFNAVATALHESSMGDATRQPATTYDLGLVGSRLSVGTHVLAIIGLNQLVSSSDFIQIPDLSFGGVSSTCMSGSIAANTTWYASNSPIVVCGSVTVNSGVTLTIQPGTTVQFDAGINLVVANGGILLAAGTSNAPIHFTRSGASGFWGNITIDGAVGSPESRIAYADFQFNANSTGTPCIEVNAGTAFLDHLTFGNTGAPYIHVDSASFIISDCYFPASTAGFEQCHGTGGIKSGGHGLVLRNFWGKGNGYNDIFDFTGGNRNQGQPITQFIGNVLMGGDDDGLDLDGTDAWVEGNIFLHFHKNAGTPDSSSGVSGGNTGADTSDITVIRNIFFDCDAASDAKQGNFYTYLNNTILHQNHSAGNDSTGAVVVLADTGTAEGAGIYFEGNIIYDIEQFTRGVTNAIITFSNNLLPVAWGGAGGNNTVGNPLFKHVPTVAEATFANWAQAQVMWDWLSLQSNSPAIGTGPNGTDKGAVTPYGASISGAPNGTTTQSNATLVVGINRKGSGIPTGGFPLGSGYTHYKWRLDSNAWSAETPIASSITLNNLSSGPHYVEVSGKRDSSTYQDDTLNGVYAQLSRTATWTVGSGVVDSDGDGMPDDWEMAHGLNKNLNDADLDPDGDRMTNLQEYLAGTDPQDPASRLWLQSVSVPGNLAFRFTAISNKSYTVQFRTSLNATSSWQPLQNYTALTTNRSIAITNLPIGPQRFYRIVTPLAP